MTAWLALFTCFEWSPTSAQAPLGSHRARVPATLPPPHPPLGSGHTVLQPVDAVASFYGVFDGQGVGSDATSGDFDNDGYVDVAAGAFDIGNYDGQIGIYRGPVVSGAPPDWLLLDDPGFAQAEHLGEHVRLYPAPIPVLAAAVDTTTLDIADNGVYLIIADVLFPGLNFVADVGTRVSGAAGPLSHHVGVIDSVSVFAAHQRNEVFLIPTGTATDAAAPDVALLTVSSVEYDGHFCEAVDLGDLDGDGASDLAIGEYGTNSGGRVDLYLGPFPVGTTLSQETDSTLTIEGYPAPPDGLDIGEWFGGDLQVVPDVQGDGSDDLLVGASNTGFSPAYDNGGAFLWHTVPVAGAVPADADWKVASMDSDGMGEHVTAIGDANGDGSGDIAMSAPAWSVVWVFYGPHYGFHTETSADVLLGAGVPNTFGRAIAGAGDQDGDGLDDLLVGNTQADPAGLSNAGALYVFGSTTF